MEITVNADEAYYLTYALQHAIKRVEKHAKKVGKIPDGGGAYSLTMRDVQWLQALLDEVVRKTPPLECP
jgi:hypothetical protein